MNCGDLLIKKISFYLVQSVALDILTHLPRTLLSQNTLAIILWVLKFMGVQDVPSVDTQKALNESLLKTCGVHSLKYKGALGHTYYVNSLADTIAQVNNYFFPITIFN